VKTLALSGSTVASFTVGGRTHTVDVARGCVTCTAAREMLVQGVNPAEELDVRRDGEPVFTRCLPVAWWARWSVVEDAERGPIFRLLTPTEQTHSAQSASRVSTSPKDEAPVYGPSVWEG